MKEGGDGPKWYQLYWPSKPSLHVLSYPEERSRPDVINVRDRRRLPLALAARQSERVYEPHRYT